MSSVIFSQHRHNNREFKRVNKQWCNCPPSVTSSTSFKRINTVRTVYNPNVEFKPFRFFFVWRIEMRLWIFIRRMWSRDAKLVAFVLARWIWVTFLSCAEFNLKSAQSALLNSCEWNNKLEILVWIFFVRRIEMMLCIFFLRSKWLSDTSSRQAVVFVLARCI